MEHCSARKAGRRQYSLAEAENCSARKAAVRHYLLEDAEHCCARTAGELQYFLADAEHYLATKAAVRQYSLAVVGIDCCMMFPVVRGMLQLKCLRPAAGEYFVEAVGTDLLDQDSAVRFDLQGVAGLQSGLLEIVLNNGRLGERYTFHHK